MKYYEIHIDGEGSIFFESEKNLTYEAEIIKYVTDKKITKQVGAIDWAIQITKKQYNKGKI